jgi:hypothetical protein
MTESYRPKEEARHEICGSEGAEDDNPVQTHT